MFGDKNRGEHEFARECTVNESERKRKKIDNLVSYPEPNVKQHQARLKLRNFVQNKTVE